MRLSPSRFREIDQAFDEAFDVSPSERPAFLAGWRRAIRIWPPPC